MRPSRDTWILIVVFVLLLVGGYFAASPGGREESDISSTYSADPKGVKAFYTLLGERLGYKVERLTQPCTQIPREAAVLIVVQPLEPLPIIEPEASSLERWVKKGGTAIFISDDLSGIPRRFRTSKKLGKGSIHTFDSRKVITNEGLRDSASPFAVLNVIVDHTTPGEVILFDEYHHGLMESGSVFALMGRHVKIAIAILLVAGLVLCHTRGRRFGAVRRLPSSETTRPGYEFVESLARLYQRAHAPDLAAEILCKSFKRSLCLKLGLPADAAADAIARHPGSGTNEHIKNRVTDLLARCEKPGAGQRLSNSELVTIAAEIQSLEQELGLERIDA